MLSPCLPWELKPKLRSSRGERARPGLGGMEHLVEEMSEVRREGDGRAAAQPGQAQTLEIQSLEQSPSWGLGVEVTPLPCDLLDF